MTERDRSDDYAREEARKMAELKNLEENITVMISKKGLARTLAEIVQDPGMFRWKNRS